MKLPISLSATVLSFTILTGCGSESDSNQFDGKFSIDTLTGLYSVSTSVGDYTIRFAEPNETNTSGKGFLFDEDFLTLDPDLITANSVGEEFEWEISIDGELTLNYPLSGKQERLTLTDDNKALYELDSQQDGDFEYEESNIKFARITNETLDDEFVSLETLVDGEFELITNGKTISYELFDVVATQDNLKFGSRTTNGKSEQVLWATNYVNTNPSPTSEDILVGRLLIVRFTLQSTLNAPVIEIVNLTSNDNNQMNAQFFADYVNNKINDGFQENTFEYIDNNASFNLIEEVAED